MDILFGASLISEMKLHYRLGLSGKILVLCAYCHIDLKSPGFFIFFFYKISLSFLLTLTIKVHRN